MKTFYSFIALILIVLYAQSAEGQLTGTKTIKTSGGDFATFTAAITALNTSGVGAGGVVFNVDAGFTVTELCPIITATGTSANPIVFQKSGAGSNPVITAGTGTSTTIDGIIRISGGDYITFDGIDVAENSANTTATTRMEFGYYIYNASATNGAMYNTIKNCKIILNRLNTTTIGIYQYTATTSTNQLTGNNNYNKYYNITIENSYTGIYLRATSSTYFDVGCEIGTISGGTTTIGASTTNDIGNGSGAVYGIRASYQKDVQIFNTTIRNVTCTSNTNRIAGVFLENSYGTSAIYNNIIGPISATSTTASTANYLVSGMRLDVATNSTVNVYNNFIFGITSGQNTATASDPATVIQATGIAMGVTAGTSNLFYNSIRIEGSTYINSACVTSTGGTAHTMTLKNNILSNFTSTQSGVPKHYGVMKQGASGTLTGLDYNDYYIANTGNGYVGYYTSDKATISDWRSTLNMDTYSISENPPFTSSTNLHLLTGTATILESGGTNISTPSITTDIDGATRNASTPDIGADEGSFTAGAKTINWYTINQASSAVVYPNTVNQEILRIDVCVVGSAGTLPLNSMVVNSANISDADVSGVKLYRTSTPTFSTSNPLGSATNFSGGIATFNSLNYDLPTVTTTYLWIVYDVVLGAVSGNTLDAIVLANQININGITYPASNADPAGTRLIVSAMKGNYAIPGDYPTISAAIADLNLRGQMGRVFFNVAAGYNESTSDALLITATGTSSNTITFRKDPSTSGTNPLITRTDAGSITPTRLGGLGDAIIILEGSDYITIDGIDVQASQSTIEFGYYLRKVGTTNTSDGCKNDVIKNCTVTMTKGTSAYVVGICCSNNTATTGATSSTSTGATVDSEGGRNENITIIGNTIQNTFAGMCLIGYNHQVSPYNYFDQNFIIGGESGAGNIIKNFGGNTASNSSGVYAAYQNNANISYNTINNTDGGGTGFTSYCSGINLNYGISINITVSYNLISLNSASGSNYMYGIYNNAGDANSTLNVHHNIVENCFHSSSGAFSAFNNGVSVTLNLYSNTVRNNTINSGASSMLNLGSAGTANVYDNIVENNTIAGGTGTNTAISSAGTVVNIYGNSISGYTSTAAARVYPISITGGTSVNVYNNLIYDINTMYTHAKIDAIRGISITSSTVNSNIGVYYNTIYLDASAGGTDSWTSCVYDTSYATSTTATLDMRNNILVNVSTPSGSGIASAFRRGGSTLNNYSTLSNNNLLYAGAPGASNLIYYDGTNSYQTLADYTTAVGPTREINSVSGDPGFTSSTNLIPNPSNSNSWILSGNGIHIAGITTDFAGTTRPSAVSEGAPDIGAYEFTAGLSTPNSFVITPSSGSNDVYVNGRKLINLYFSNLGGITSINVKYYSGVNPPQTNGFPVMNGYFIVTQTGGSGYIYDITYYYSEPQMGSIVNEANIRLSKSDNGGTNWDVYSVLGTGAGEYQLDNTANTIKVYQLNSFSIFTNGSIDNPLPVQLSSFTYTLKGRDVSISWKTSCEINNSGFDIERMTITGNKWEKIGFVSGKGTVNTPTNYLFEDKNLQSGKYKYRLKQTDVNGNYDYHNLNGEVEIGIPKNFYLSQNYPNPFNPSTKINFELSENCMVDLRLYDILGREVANLVSELKTAGYYTISFNASKLSSGIYFYRIVAKSDVMNYVKTKKMMILK